jgi:uncharacterized phage protein (TIGR01671 family)
MELERGMWRGKHLDNGEWIAGYLCPVNTMPAIVRELYFADQTNKESEMMSRDWAFVDPSTLGEWTGIYDKNGEPIFEGDILAHWLRGEVISKRTVYYDTCYTSYNLPDASNKELCDYEVIGNKWDNPDLLGVE